MMMMMMVVPEGVISLTEKYWSYTVAKVGLRLQELYLTVTDEE